jgi:hypothetical protein
VNSSSCPSPIIEEESSTNSPVIPLDLRLEDTQHYPIPDHSDKLNDFLCGVLRDPKSEELAYEYYKKAKEKQEFRPKRPMLKLLIRYLIQSEKWVWFCQWLMILKSIVCCQIAIPFQH